METGWDHGCQHYHNLGMVSTIGLCVDSLCLDRSTTLVYPILCCFHRQAFFVNGFLASKKTSKSASNNATNGQVPKMILDSSDEGNTGVE
jgi:hypothetical protein